ncbi:MAG TPA: SRPBCC family protein [Solirubrobacteraceae bacterium]|jgi:uncharacterized protein YndB with AHSA1/START domain
MPDTTQATLLEEDGRAALRFERILTHPPDRVWRALTERAELTAWHPTPFELEPVLGAPIRFQPPASVPDWPEGRVTACEPPRLLAHTWGEDSLRWELEPHPEGSRLTLTHSFDDRFKAARDAAGWELCLAALMASLDGVAPPPAAGPDEVPPGWRELNSDYERRFGIAPEHATPPPGA